MNKGLRNISIIILLLFAISFVGCKKEVKALDNRVSFIDNHSFLLTADKGQNNTVYVNRTTIGDWELFLKEDIDDDFFLIQSSDSTYLGMNENGFLTAGFNKSAFNTQFKSIYSDSSKFFRLQLSHKYVEIDSDSKKCILIDEVENASMFSLQSAPVIQATNFTVSQYVPLIIGLFFALMSLIYFHYFRKNKMALLFLILGGFFLRLFVALLDPHLVLWDEQYHAMVAKNMMSNPFSPMLYPNAELPFNEMSWVGGHIWLHKQPLFLWQIALSMKVFGANLFALRLPSVIMSTIVIFFTYRIGRIIANDRAAYFAAILYAFSNFAIELSAGAIHTDHNDVAFLFYLSASIWAWFEYEKATSNKRKYTFLVLIGVFSGGAILVKWLTGLLVYSGWGITILAIKNRRINWVNYRNLAISLLVTLVVFLPWQIYILNAFPEVSSHEFSLNSEHFFSVIEGHGGGFFWHIDLFDTLYRIPFFTLILSLVILVYTIKNNTYKIATVSIIFIIYLFFSLAATKMIAFTFCISFLVFIAIGVALDKVFSITDVSFRINPAISKAINKHASFLLIVITLIYFLNIDGFREKHTVWKQDSHSYLYKKNVTTPKIKNLTIDNPGLENYVIFNCDDYDEIPIMFFNDIEGVYNYFPNESLIKELQTKGYEIAVFNSEDLPDYLKDDSSIRLIKPYWILK